MYFAGYLANDSSLAAECLLVRLTMGDSRVVSSVSFIFIGSLLLSCREAGSKMFPELARVCGFMEELLFMSSLPVVASSGNTWLE